MIYEPQVERLGKLMYGRGLRLLVPAWILARGTESFFQTELIYDLPPRFGTNCVAILNELVDLGMVKYLPSGTVPGRARVIYQMVPDHALWESLRISIAYARATDMPAAARRAARRRGSSRRIG